MSDSYNAAERSHVKAAAKRAKSADAQQQSTLRWIMSTPQGRWWMHDLLATCHIGATPFTGHNDQTNFRCGEQNIGLQLWSALQSICPDLYIQLMQEAHERHLTLSSALAERPSSANGYGGIEGPGPDDASGEEGRDSPA